MPDNSYTATMLNHTQYLTAIPVSLYIHIPWCIRKCPYCDFNSHTLRDAIPEQEYIAKLLADLETHRADIQDRPIHSIFIGGGTPSLFSAAAYQRLFKCLAQSVHLPKEDRKSGV